MFKGPGDLHLLMRKKIIVLTIFFHNRSIAQLEHLAEIYLSNTKIDEADRLYSYSRGLDLNADTIAVSLGHLKQSAALACKDEGKFYISFVSITFYMHIFSHIINKIIEINITEGM